MCEYKQVKDLIQLFNESTISKLDLEINEFKLKLEKEVIVKQENELLVDNINNQTQSSINKEQYLEIKSPIVGVYYEQASPEALPFVEEGMMVEKGQVLCIIEAMKVMNEIIAPSQGKIIKKLVNNESFVEYDQVLLLIEEGV